MTAFSLGNSSVGAALRWVHANHVCHTVWAADMLALERRAVTHLKTSHLPVCVFCGSLPRCAPESGSDPV